MLLYKRDCETKHRAIVYLDIFRSTYSTKNIDFYFDYTLKLYPDLGVPGKSILHNRHSHSHRIFGGS